MAKTVNGSQKKRITRVVLGTVNHVLMMVDAHYSNRNIQMGAAGAPGAGGGVVGALSAVSEQGWATPVRGSARHNQKFLKVRDETSGMEKLVIGLAELGGTAILVFLGCLGCTTKDFPVEHIAFTFGLAAMSAVQCFGHISGGHINPAVTVAAATLGKITLVQVPVYLAGQLLGGLLGFGLVKAVTPVPFGNSTGKFCSPSHDPSLSTLQALEVEFLLSLVLIWACCGMWDGRNSGKEDSAPLRLGLTITVLVLAGAKHSGANLNPARSFAPALINSDWDDHWVYWVGPIAAGFVGAIVYRLIFYKEGVNDDVAKGGQISPEKA